jgi:hypothetical protein
MNSKYVVRKSYVNVKSASSGVQRAWIFQLSRNVSVSHVNRPSYTTKWCGTYIKTFNCYWQQTFLLLFLLFICFVDLHHGILHKFCSRSGKINFRKENTEQNNITIIVSVFAIPSFLISSLPLWTPFCILQSCEETHLYSLYFINCSFIRFSRSKYMIISKVCLHNIIPRNCSDRLYLVNISLSHIL